MSDINPIILLQAEVQGRSLADVAVKVGCSRQHIYAVLKGQKRPGPAILNYLGLRKYWAYERKRAHG